MRVRFFVFFFMFGIMLPLFLATTRQSGSSSSQLGKPSVKFKEWQIGRSDKNTDSRNDNPTSFITSTQDKCHFTASVGYDGNQGDNVSPIDVSTISWTVIDQDPSSMALVTSKKNWSGDSHPSKLDPSTLFNIVGTISLPAYQPTPKPDLCRDENNHRRHERTPTHRGDTKLGFTLVFSARTEDGQDIKPAKLVLKQDEKDQIRQEYVDLNKKIPQRSNSDIYSKWAGENTYDFGHYDQMLYYPSLDTRYQEWIDQMNTDYRNDKAALTKGDFTLNSGYRNPHHNYHHSSSKVALSPHMYGYAIDVEGKDLDGNGTLDRQKMVDAAKDDMPNRARWSQLYAGTTHVHADWAPLNWASISRTDPTPDPAKTFSLPPQGTDQPLTAAPAPPASLTGDCGIHTISASQTANHASVSFACGSHTYYACQTPSTSETNLHSYQTLPCGSHSGYRCTAPSSHTQTTTCPSDSDGQSCSYGSYYACSPHTHAYPELPVNPPPPPTPTVLCGNRWRGAGACMYGRVVSSSSTEHQATCSTHGTYWSCNPTAYAQHGQTRTCTRPGCGATYTNCVKGNGTCTGGTYQWHN